MLRKILHKYKTWNPPKEVRLLLLFLPIILLFFTFNIDNDFWFLINTGKTILTKGFITIEPFTIHEGLKFIPQQWLTDVIFYILYSKLGVYGIFALLVIINILIIFLMYKLCLLVSNNKVKLSLLITIVTDILLEMFAFTTRPQIFDILLLLLEIYLLELYIKKKKNKYLIGLPIISLLMLNLHASIWPILFIFLIPYFLGKLKFKWTIKEDYKLIPLIITFILMLLITIINPYKLELQEYFFNSYDISYINNSVLEMTPVNITNGLIFIIYIFMVLLTYYLNKDKKVNLRYLLLILGTTYLLLKHYKGIIFFSIASLLILSYNLKDYFPFEKKEVTSKYYLPITCFLIVGIFIICIIFIPIDKEFNNPLVKVGNYLEDNVSKNIKLYTNYNNGAYFEYLGYKTYLDARAEVFLKKNNQKEDILFEYYNLERGKLNYREFLDKYNFDYLVIDSKELLYTYIKDTNYDLVYEYPTKDVIYQIYKRK